MKKAAINRSYQIFLTVFCAILFISNPATAFASGTTINARNADYKADQSLKSNARVNPTSLAMEFSIPLGGYQGRGGGLPIVFDYSSKVWQMLTIDSWQTSYNTIISDLQPLFARRTAAGWTSNLGTPRIDYNYGIYEPFRSDVNNYDGQIFSPYSPYGENPNPQNYQLYYVKRVQVTMADGSTHEFRKDDTLHSYGTAHYPGGAGVPDLSGVFLSVDGSKMRLDLGETASTLYLPDGSRYLFGQKTTEHKAHTYIDRNGNKMTFDAANRRWTDTLGRIVKDPMPSNWHPFEQTQAVGDYTEQFPGFGATGTFDVTFSWRYLKDPQGGESGLEDTSQNLRYTSDKYCQGDDTQPVSGAYLFNNPESSIIRICAGYPPTVSTFNPIVLTKIALPNGQSYQFKYNVFGEISKIIYPTGGYERFSYGQVSAVQGSKISYDQANRGVTERWVSAKGDGTDELHWTYQTAVITSPFSLKITTTAPDGTKTEQYVYAEQADEPQPYGFGNAKTGRSYEDRVLSPTNQILRRKLTSYETSGAQSGGYADATRDLRPSKEVIIIFEPNNSYALASMTETVYDTNTDAEYFAALNPKQIKTYNYIVLTDLNVAQTATIGTISAMFSSSDLASVSEIDYLYDTNYKARNITGLPTETRIKDASGNTKAKSQIFYDESAYPFIDYGSTTNWENPNTTYRGNPTTTRSWTDIAANQYVETHAQYDNFGNQRKVWDGRNNMTETEYSSTYLFAYPTKVKTPIPDTSGTHGANTELISEITYDFNTALPISTTDANGQTAQMSYADPTSGQIDPLLRIRKVTAPNGHQTITEYGAGNTEATRWVKVKTQIDATTWKEGYSWFDGIGRPIKSQSVDEHGDIFTETEYDNMGRVKKVSNPYRTGETIYKTESFYDDLGRVTKIKTPDNAEVLTSYDLATVGSQFGTVVTVKDQALRERRSITNALGQLIRVDEPNESNQLGTINAPNQPTNYGYDILNNLVQVQQIGTNTAQCGGVVSSCTQTRSFVYDALSRLKSATNPESGTIQYSYDNNGNLTQKTDAKGVQTNYVYDNINRIKTRSYANEPSGQTATQTVNYYYDNLTNAKGKLIEVDNTFSETKYLSFDIMGRVTSSQQITDGTTYNPMSYVYNLSGALLDETYPSGRVVKNTLDQDGDLMKVESKKNSSDYFRNYANSFVYTASGAVSSMKLGNGKFETTQFNTRLQPTQISLGSSVGNANLLKLNYDYGTTQNNGNVLSQTITVERSNQSPLVFTQSYMYDSLNRLQSAEEVSGGQTTWKQTYTFDRFGNRRFNQAATTFPTFTNTNISNPQIDPTNNRFTTGQGYTYDLAGNLLTDAEGRTFTHDAENKQKTAANSGGTIGQYFYDGDGKRVKKTGIINGQSEETIFVYDAFGKLVAEYSTAVSTTPKIQYQTTDTLGTPRINTNELGAVVSRSDYMPYGEEIVGLGNRTSTDKYVSDDVRQGFTGYIKDDETGLDFAEARMYAKHHGRFTSTDPIIMEKKRLFDPQAIALYVYTRNNPLKFIDPDGKEYVGADGKRVEYEKKDGKIVVKKGKETEDLKKLVKAINQSGSKTAIDRFMALNKNKTKVTIKMTKDENFKYSGQHFVQDKNGNLLDVEYNAEDRAKAAFTPDGKEYAAATIVFREDLIYNENQINAEKADNPSANGDDLLTLNFVHESVHDTDPKQIGAVYASQQPENKNKPFDPRVFHPTEMKDGKMVNAKGSPAYLVNQVRSEIAEYKKRRR